MGQVGHDRHTDLDELRRAMESGDVSRREFLRRAGALGLTLGAAASLLNSGESVAAAPATQATPGAGGIESTGTLVNANAEPPTSA